MKPNFEKKLRLYLGVTSLIFAIFLLVLFVLITSRMANPSAEEIFGIIISALFIISLFFVSANSFIKYGTCLGIDYSLQQMYKNYKY